MYDDSYRLGPHRIVRTTDKAILVHPLEDSYGEDFWVPKSQIHDDSEVYSETSPEGELVVTRWWAEKQGLT